MRVIAMTNKTVENKFPVLFMAQEFKSDKVIGHLLTPNKQGSLYHKSNETIELQTNKFDFSLMTHSENNIIILPSCVYSNPYLSDTYH